MKAGCGFNYFRGYQFSWIAENLHIRGYLISWFCQFLYTKPIENMIFVEHLNSWFTCTHETHENWYPTNDNESTVLLDSYSVLSFLLLLATQPIKKKMWYVIANETTIHKRPK